jgi:hypothetical protein
MLQAKQPGFILDRCMAPVMQSLADFAALLSERILCIKADTVFRQEWFQTKTGCNNWQFGPGRCFNGLMRAWNFTDRGRDLS